MSENPLLSRDYRIPFNEITPAHVVPAVRAALAEGRRDVAQVAAEERERSYDNTVHRLDEATERVDRVVGVVRHLLNVRDTPALRAAYDEVNAEITEFYAGLLTDQALWRAVRAYADTAEARTLTGVRRRNLDKLVRSFVRAGAELPAEQREAVVRLQVEEAKLEKRYAENVLDSTNAFELVLTDEAELAGLPASAVARARADAAAHGLEGWRFTLHGPSYLPFMENAERRDLRRRMYDAYAHRATQEGRDNRPLIGALLMLRRRRARALGYRDFADYQTEERMAGSGERALGFVRDLTERTLPYFRAEVEELERYATGELGYDRLEPWDVAYVMERIRKSRYDLDPEEFRPYFPLDGALRGMFDVVGRLFGIRVEERRIPEVWHPDVRYFEIHDQADGAHVGSFYADFFPRPDKRGGAWMDELITGGPGEHGFAPHLALISCNFTPPEGGKPALLSKDEVETLFHEFGHCLHHCLSRVEVPARAGTHVAWDFVELPSQLMENWTWEREALDLIARHHETGEALPEELFQRMERARTFMGGYAQMRQLSFGTVDLALHVRHDPESGEAPLALAEEVMRPFAIRPDVVNPDMLAAFSHIFSGAYSAGYYSYKWAEVLDADAFTRFETEGIFNPATGRAYLDAILSRGDSADPMELFREFMGREPDPEALLRRVLAAA